MREFPGKRIFSNRFFRFNLELQAIVLAGALLSKTVVAPFAEGVFRGPHLASSRHLNAYGECLPRRDSRLTPMHNPPYAVVAELPLGRQTIAVTVNDPRLLEAKVKRFDPSATRLGIIIGSDEPTSPDRFDGWALAYASYRQPDGSVLRYQFDELRISMKC